MWDGIVEIYSYLKGIAIEVWISGLWEYGFIPLYFQVERPDDDTVAGQIESFPRLGGPVEADDIHQTDG